MTSDAASEIPGPHPKVWRDFHEKQCGRRGGQASEEKIQRAQPKIQK